MIIVVSGLPRSGTSMMMQMLEAGGQPVLVDDTRKADASNLLGYYEYAPVKNLPTDSSWVSTAEGKAVKVVSPLLRYLPDTFHYRIIFMERDVTELLASQNVLLAMKGGEAATPRDRQKWEDRIHRHLGEVLHWLAAHPFIPHIRVRYRQVLVAPRPCAERISRFLERPMDTRMMAAAIQPTLCNHR